jgi:hypothetical protein
VEQIKDYVDLGEAMDFIRSEDKRTKTLGNYTERIDYIPATRFKIPIDSAHIINTRTVRAELADKIVPEMRWQINKQNLYKNELMVLDLIDNNNWKRPVYYSVTVDRNLYLNLHEYFQLQGLAYRIAPIHQPEARGQLGSIDTDLMFDNMVNKFRWGGVSDSTVYLDENIRRMMMNFRNNFGRLANELIAEGDTTRARMTLDRCMQIMPNERIPFNFFMIPVIEAYYKIGETGLANSYLLTLSDLAEEELRYFLSLGKEYSADVDYDKQVRMHIMQELVRLVSEYQQEELIERQQQIFQNLVVLYQSNA